MTDSTVRVKYVGAVRGYSEVSLTGFQQMWNPGQTAFVTADRADQLTASGLFSRVSNVTPVSVPDNVPAMMNGAGTVLVSPVTGLPIHQPEVLFQAAGSLASPLATLTGTTSANFVLPAGNLMIPAGTLVPGKSILHVNALLRRHGTNSTAVRVATIGISNSGLDNGFSDTMTATDNYDSSISGTAAISGNTMFTVPRWLAPGESGAFGISDRTTSFDVSLDNYVNFGIRSANVADSFDLISYCVILTRTA